MIDWNKEIEDTKIKGKFSLEAKFAITSVRNNYYNYLTEKIVNKYNFDKNYLNSKFNPKDREMLKQYKKDLIEALYKNDVNKFVEIGKELNKLLEIIIYRTDY